MKTDDLIRALVADPTPVATPVSRLLAAAILGALAVGVVLFAVLIGPRPDVGYAVGDPRFLFKFVVTLVLAATSIVAILHLSRPDAEPASALLALAAAPALLAIGVLVELALIDPAARMERLVGTNWSYCLTYVPILSLPFLAAALIALRHGAPSRPAVAGAVAGLVAGGLGATLYAAHCIDDSPLFVATWYTVAIAGVAAAGAVIGMRVLRW